MDNSHEEIWIIRLISVSEILRKSQSLLLTCKGKLEHHNAKIVSLADSQGQLYWINQNRWFCPNFSQNISNKLFHTCDKIRNSWDFSDVQQWECLRLPSTGFQLPIGRKDLHISSASVSAKLAGSKIHMKTFLFYYWVPIHFLLDLLFSSHLDHPASLPPKHKHPHTKSFPSLKLWHWFFTYQILHRC